MSGETFMGLLAPNLQPLRRFFERKASAEADDILQQTVLRAFTRREQLRAASKFKSWLWAIAWNELRMFLRTRQTTISLDELPGFDPPERALSPLARCEQAEKREWLIAGMARLAARERASIRMVDFGGLTIAEAAEVLAISESASKTVHFRARRRLARVLRQPGQVGPSYHTNRT